MKSTHVPRIEPRYWAAITLASIFGTNTGDLFAHDSGLGLLGGLPILAAIVVAIWLLERRDDRPHEAWYWLAIIVIRTGATNIADYLCGRRHLGIDRVGLSIGLALFIAAIVWRRTTTTQSDLPDTDARYWLAMLAAGVLGTAGGDAVLHAFGGPEGIGGVIASTVLAIVLAAVLLLGRGAFSGPMAAVYVYWLTVCVARTTGTAVADMLAENTSLNIGLPLSTICTGIAFVAALVVWKPGAKGAAVIA